MAVSTTRRATLAAGNTAGTGGITTYANNVAPDVIVKAAYDAPWMHVEVGGIGRFLRNEFFPVLSTAWNGHSAPRPTRTARRSRATRRRRAACLAAIRVYPVEDV